MMWECARPATTPTGCMCLPCELYAATVTDTAWLMERARRLSDRAMLLTEQVERYQRAAHAMCDRLEVRVDV